MIIKVKQQNKEIVTGILNLTPGIWMALNYNNTVLLVNTGDKRIENVHIVRDGYGIDIKVLSNVIILNSKEVFNYVFMNSPLLDWHQVVFTKLDEEVIIRNSSI